MSLPRSLQELMRKCNFIGKSQEAVGSAGSADVAQPCHIAGFTSGDSAYCVGREAGGSSSSTRIVRLPEPTPSTPQGLKPRRSVASLKSYLQINGDRHDRSGSRLISSGAGTSEQSLDRPATMPLSTLSSPIVSTSIFYSSSSCATPGAGTASHSGMSRGNVAESPVLLPGRARTAVGALVAATSVPVRNCDDGDPRNDDAYPRRKLSAPSLSPFQTTTASSARTMNRSLQSILPPFDEEEYQRGCRFNCASGSDGTPSLPSMFDNPSSPDMFENLRRPGDAPQPRRLLETTEFPPLPSMSPIGADRYENLVDKSVDSVEYSPSQSILASPSSLAKGLLPGSRLSQDAISFHDQEAPGGTRYDQRSPISFVSHEEAGDVPFDRDLMLKKQKSSNQRRAHEDLVLAVQERLQDDLEIVREIQRRLGSETNFAGSENGNQSLLAGLTTESVKRATDTLLSLLKELDMAEQFYFASPSDMDAVAVPRNDFRDALRFCLRLVQVSATIGADNPLQENNWRLSPGVRASLGLIPETPQMIHRGGDTSVFSLPCDDSSATPMASNVSISTTITTRTHGTSLHSPRQHHQAPRFHHQALEVRHTIMSVATLLDRFSTLLLEDRFPAQEIKRAYLEVQMLDVSSLKSVLESFEMTQPQSLVELMSGSVSHDEGIPGVPPPYVMSRSSGATGPTVSEGAVSQDALEEFFSPVLRSKSENRPVGGNDATEVKENQVAHAGVESKVQHLEDRGRRGRCRASRSSLKLQDPLTLA